MRRWLIITTVAALAAAAVTASAAGAASKDAHGWWWRPQSGLLGAQIPPPGVPEDGLAVEATPDGPNAIAALRYLLEAGEAQPALVLTVADQQGELAIQACAATQRWDADAGGPWDERPTYDCGTAVDGAPAEDGKTWRWELDALLHERRLDVVLVPAPGGGRVTFEAPDDASLKTQSAGGQTFDAPPVTDFTPNDSSSGTSAADGSSAPSFADEPSTTAGPMFPAGDAGSDAAPPIAPQDPAVAPPGASEFQPPQAAGPAEDQVAATATAPASNDSSRTIGAIVAAMAAILALSLWHQDSAVPRRMGALTKAGVGVGPQSYGGLGRFARPRTGSPRPLL